MNLGLDNVRLRNKMLIVFCLAVFAPLIITDYIFYSVTASNVKAQRMAEIERSVEQVKNEFRSEVEDAVTISSGFYTDHLLNEIIEAKYENPADYIEAYDSYLRRILNSFTPVYHSVQAVTIYVDNTTLLYSGGIAFMSDEVKRSNWYRLAASSKLSQPLLVQTGANPELLDTFSIIREMDYYSSHKADNKVLKVDLRTDAVRKIFTNVNFQGNLYLLNPRNEVAFSTDPASTWATEQVQFDPSAMPKDTIVVQADYAYINLLNGWRIVATVAEHEVLREVQKSRNFIVWSAFAIILLPTLIIVWTTRSVNARIIQILKQMKRVQTQSFEPIPHVEARDEIGQLAAQFNRMTFTIKSLIDDVYVADIQRKSLELERRQAQLNALQSQINPHFLFNALETIRMRSLMKEEKETAKIIHNMAKIFRNSLTWNKDRVTVKEELELVVCFLEIQKYRFEDKLRYDINVSPEVYGITLPKLTFLPFVENASIHGIESLKSGGRIAIAITREGDMLHFVIEDNGAGMHEDKVAQLLRYLKQEEAMGERIGVQNVLYRMKLYYGERFEFQVASAPGAGTRITLGIPIEIEQ
ncbi:two-component system sensor histidine kinase YesM [Paenibacillus phyllosphaerae]|uniref:Two-component system sensor histidine kinase YesM n=1 Tax=Paenibacillus phyllosphaerae TaxID=274593 RepID=A0A7W5FN93_9BACL|nr:sensor histidine kinase [Paenibacillus phyllosphaerae]MBB3111070.1 two-component system sensor histidine kinase YesM [Paenibacillus phyllosphaerae]